MGSRWIMQRWNWALSPHSVISKSKKKKKKNCGNSAREIISCQMNVKSKLARSSGDFFFHFMIHKTCLRRVHWPFLSHFLSYCFFLEGFSSALDMDACLVSARHVSCCSSRAVRRLSPLVKSKFFCNGILLWELILLPLAFGFFFKTKKRKET